MNKLDIVNYYNSLDNDDKSAFKDCYEMAEIAGKVITDEELSKILRGLIRQYGKSNPRTRGFDVRLNPLKYENANHLENVLAFN